MKKIPFAFLSFFLFFQSCWSASQEDRLSTPILTQSALVQLAKLESQEDPLDYPRLINSQYPEKLQKLLANPENITEIILSHDNKGSKLFLKVGCIQHILLSEFLTTHLGLILRTIRKTVGKLINLEVLNLSYIDLGDSRTSLLTLVLESEANCLLKKLSLSKNNIDATGIGILVSGFHRLTCLEKINLCENPLKAEGVIKLAKKLRFCKNLQTLSLDSTDMGDSGAEELVRELSNVSQLRELHLARNNIGPIVAKRLGLKLPALTCLEQIDLGGNPLKAEGVKDFAKHLNHLKKLKILFLDSTDMGDLGITCLAQVLEPNHPLTELSIAKNNIGPAGIKALWPKLRSLNFLDKIRLNENPIGIDGIKTISEGLLKLTVFHCNKIASTPQETTAILESFKSFPNLQFLSSKDNFINPEDMKEPKKFSYSI